MIDSVDYESEYQKKEKEINDKIQKECENFKRIKSNNDKFREIYDWIIALIELTDIIKERIEGIEASINEIKKEMTNEKK